jgi:vacuolar protein 8
MDNMPLAWLWQLTCQDYRKIAIARSSAVAPHVALLRGGGTDTDTEAAIQELVYFARHEHGDAIAQAGAIPQLVTLLHGHRDDACKVAATQLLRALGEQKHTHAIVQAGAIPPLVTILRTEGTDTLKEAATHMLGLLTIYEYGSAPAIVRAGAIDPLMKLIGAGRTDALRVATTRALWDVVSRDDNHVDTTAYILNAGIIGSLVSMLDTSGSNALKQEAIDVLRSIFHSGHANAIEQAGTIPIFLKMLRTHETDRLKFNAACALWELAKDDTRIHRIADAGAIPICVALLSAGDSGNDARSLKREVAYLLQRLAHSGYTQNIQQARARNHWAIARAFVNMHACATFWYAHICKQLCAPGGKWAESDRASFEEDFSRQQQQKTAFK